ncbi:MAG: glyceraldehyde 3-phosphate dehydrogenase NAD-binding domain-containing protein, partial [Eubacteriales bacterium]|nr:glyceraldehyde 3-phosphate dehydrogenase NAD-binding domain-containing protein [Eubacteriales bacterium]
MAIKIGINGFGRIGRVTFRAAMEQPEHFEVKGINVRNVDLDYLIYMIRYDTIYGRYC